MFQEIFCVKSEADRKLFVDYNITIAENECI